MNPLIIDLGAALIMGLAAFLFGLFLFPPPDYKVRAPVRGFMASKRRKMADESPGYRMFSQVLRVLCYHIEKVKAPNAKEALADKLAKSGYIGGFTADEWIGVMLCSGGAFAGLAIFFSAALFQSVAIGLPMFVGMFGIYFPFMWLDEQFRARMTRINKDLPYFIDVLALSVGAGLDFNGSIRRICERDTRQGPLIEEMRYVLQEVSMGVTRREALLNLKDRVPSEYIRSMVSSIIQAEQMGTPLTQILRIQAQSIRLKRSQRAERLAGEAPVKMIMPLLFIVAAVMLTLFGGIIVRAVRGELF